MRLYKYIIENYTSNVKTMRAKDIKEGDYLEGMGKVSMASMQSGNVVIRCGKKKHVYDQDDKVMVMRNDN